MLVALTVTVIVELTAGAVKSPLVEMLPLLADHFTSFWLLPLTHAVNCCEAHDASVAFVGVTLILA